MGLSNNGKENGNYGIIWHMFLLHIGISNLLTKPPCLLTLQVNPVLLQAPRILGYSAGLSHAATADEVGSAPLVKVLGLGFRVCRVETRVWGLGK